MGNLRVRAFTLVELLVVMAVIAVMMALLLPALSSARDVAMRTTCASYVRNTSQATILYSTANADVMPPGQLGFSTSNTVAPINSTSAGASWATDGYFQVYDYVTAFNFGLNTASSYEYEKGHNVNLMGDAMIRQPFAKFNKFRTCPVVMRNSEIGGEDLTRYPNGFFSFAYNSWVGGICRPGKPNTRTAGGVNNNYTISVSPMKYTNIPRPSDCILYTDVNPSSTLPGEAFDCKSQTATSSLATYNDVVVKTARPNLVGAEHGRVYDKQTYSPYSGATVANYIPVQYGYVNIGCADGSVVTYFAKFDSTNEGGTNGGTSGGGLQWNSLYLDPSLQ